MATATVASRPLRPLNLKKVTLVVVGCVLAAALLAVLIVGGWFYYSAKAALPQLDGTIQLSGLRGPVTVIRDGHGVPHIKANTLEDALFAQGFITAQDRLWQMDMSRRFGRGTLSEVLGARTANTDRRQRLLNLVPTAEKAIAALSAEERAHIDAYVRGVNALIERQMSALPIEFKVLGYKPGPWTAVDSMMVGINISGNLNTQYPLEMEREDLIRNLAPELVADLYPNASWRDRPPSMLSRNQQHLPDAPPEGAPGPDEDARRFVGWLTSPLESSCSECVPGSNNWTVSGAHTTTGKPLVSNDMHLGHSIPNVWYQVHVQAPGYNVTGVSFPGLPFVIAGHNERIAFGFTNVGPDVQDLYIENFNDKGEYQTPDGWMKPETRKETISTKKGPLMTFDVMVTRHGPIINPTSARKLSLRWTIYDPKVLTFRFYDIGRSQFWERPMS